MQTNPYEPPAEILSKLPKDFYPMLDETDWSKRKKALDQLQTL
jgi:hypothetical protein